MTALLLPCGRFQRISIAFLCRRNQKTIRKMENTELTFNDLPRVVARLLDEVSGMKLMLAEMRNVDKPRKADTHQPMSVEEASAYMRIPLGTFYMKLANGTIPATKPGKRYVLYKDELDKWLEANRKNPVPLTADEENEAIMSTHRRKPGRKDW